MSKLCSKAEVTFTRSSDTVIGDIVRKCLYGLFLQAGVRGLLIAFSFWTTGRAPEYYHSVWKDRYLAITARRSELISEIFLLVMFFPGNFYPSCSVQQQQALHKKRLFSS